jgi:hypothetical protein
MSHLKRFAVVVIANDRFIDFFIPFLESFRGSNPDLRLIVIPFDECIDKVQALSEPYRFEIYRGRFDAIDFLSRSIFGSEPYLKNRMRKLLAFDLELDEFLYMDTDILVQQPLDIFFGRLSPDRIDLIYLSKAGAVYKSETEHLIHFRGSERFATGFFVSSNEVTNVDQICSVMLSQRELFLQVRVEHLYDQPLLNFFFGATNRKTSRARNLGITSIHCSVFRRKSIQVSDEGKLLTKGNNVVTLAHWAGPRKFSPALPFVTLLDSYAQKAKSRLASVPKLSDWKPFFER